MSHLLVVGATAWDDAATAAACWLAVQLPSALVTSHQVRCV